MLTKQFSESIGLAIAAGFLLIASVGYMIFIEVNNALLSQYEQQFQIESQSRIDTFKDHIINTTQTLQSYAQLPSFRSIRYHSLTLNRLAVDENIRQLELFFFEILRSNNNFMGVQYIDDKGDEIFKVDRLAISSNLGNILHNEDFKHSLNQNLGRDDIHLDAVKDEKNELVSLFWWVPVYVSSAKRSGYLVFDVDISLLRSELLDISEKGLTYVAITDDHDDIAKGSHQLISEIIPDDVDLNNDQWVVSSELPLTGLNWKIYLIGNENSHTKGVITLLSVIKYGFVPAITLFTIFLFYIFRKKIEADKHIHHLAYYDSLTGLINRHQFDIALKDALEEIREHDQHHALLYLDLDQFKVVNDTCGHLAGDKLLEQLAAYLKHSVRESDMLARLGGDEFALLLNFCPEEMAISIANKLLIAVSDFQFVWEDKSFSVGASIGVVFITDPDESASNVLRKADLACYMAKELGRNRIHVYADEDKELGERHGEMEWVSRLKQALDKDLFFLVAQPIVPLSGDQYSSRRYEILIRLNDKDKIIEPGAFIPAAERYGIMPEIDRWVIDKSFSFLAKLRRVQVEQPCDFKFSINVSGLSLGDKDFLQYIKKKFLQYDIPHGSICFEITETSAITNLSVAMNFISSVKLMGCSLALDDFGSGLCSFSYLKSIPVDFLKIDGSFVTRMMENSLDMAIVVAIREISIATGSKVIAEFVSTPEIMEKLRELGIDYAQGYAVSKPVSMINLFKYIEFE